MEIDAAASAAPDLRSDERKFRWVPCAIATLAFTSAVLVAWVLWPTAPNRAPIRLSADLGVNADLFTQLGSAVLLSPDGKLLAFVASSGNEPRRIYIRKLNELLASALPGTENARDPFFSPSGQWIAFFADGMLKKVPVNGGPPVPICEAANDRGGSWGEDGFIVFAPIPLSGLVRVSSSGGTPEPITKLQAGEATHRWPQLIQGGRVVLYTASSTPAEYWGASIVVESIPGGDRRVLRQGASYARYLPSGHLVYLQGETTLFAAPFDLQQRKITGDPTPVLEGIESSVTSGATNFAFSTAGSIAYVGGTGPRRYLLAWMDQEGKTQPLRSVPALYRDIRVSPVGTRIAISYATQGQTDIWVYDWARETMSRVTSHPASDLLPVWTPDGQRITFASSRDKSINIYWQSADGSSDAQRLTESANNQLPLSWHPDGKFLAFREATNGEAWNLMILPMNGDAKSGWKPGTATPFFSGPGNVLQAAFSPDGNWIAYQSNESGTYEIYVRPFPGPGQKSSISSAGGDHPVWSPKTKELFYRAPDRRFMVVSYSTAGGSFQPEKPRVWSEGTVPNGAFAQDSNSIPFDIDADGKRFAIIKPDSPSATKFDKVVLIFNFFDELRRMTSASSK
jgi:serine/threonine-protein kinase